MDNPKRFYLSGNDKIIGGVCGGLANYFGLDPVLVRIAMFVLLWCASAGFWIYLLLWIVAPSDNKLLK
ncbi:MAG: PspC domain-containing protein [Prevotella sp.]|nr:PspC domain-containing protein [Prevotella sp.]MDO5526216.1 PspC domain-containing protein [Prevotella sp.]